jgi:hypothetical protein
VPPGRTTTAPGSLQLSIVELLAQADAKLFVVCGISAAVFAHGYAKAIRTSDGLTLSRVLGGSLLHVVEMIGAAVFFAGYLAGLYVAAVAMVANTCYMITAA